MDDVELIKGSTKLLLLAIAYRVPQHYAKTEPTSLAEFQELTGIQVRQIRNCRDLLMKLGEVEVEAGGHRAVYALPRMVGPLFACRNPAKIAGFTGASNGEKPAKIAGFCQENPAKIAHENGKDCRPDAGGVLSLDLSTTQDLRTTTTPEAAAAVEAFLDWFVREYPQHRGGVLYRVDPATAELVVRELLAGRSVERLQAMARAMWAERQDPWILQSDYSLHVLRHRAVQLENRVVTAELRRGPGAHVIRDTPENRLARILRRLDEHAGGTLGPACELVATALRTGSTDFAVMDHALLGAAGEVIDQAACEASARESLEPYQARMSAAAYGDALRAGIHDELRRRANLPNVSELASTTPKEATA